MSLSSQEISPRLTLISVNNSGELRAVLAYDQMVPVALVIAEPEA
jgi:hypothetical protein